MYAHSTALCELPRETSQQELARRVTFDSDLTIWSSQCMQLTIFGQRFYHETAQDASRCTPLPGLSNLKFEEIEVN